MWTTDPGSALTSHRVQRAGLILASRTRIKTLTSQTVGTTLVFGGDVIRPAALPDSRHRHHSRGRHVVARGLGARKGRPSISRGGDPVRDVAGDGLLLHPHVTVLLDTAAASRLQLASYYTETYQGKPSWQGF